VPPQRPSGGVFSQAQIGDRLGYWLGLKFNKSPTE
jgi:hypothetical protein